MTRRYNRRKAQPITQLLGADSVDTRDFHGHVGALIRIEPFTLFKVHKVLVAICAERAGLIGHGLATPQPNSPSGFTHRPSETALLLIGQLVVRLSTVEWKVSQTGRLVRALARRYSEKSPSSC